MSKHIEVTPTLEQIFKAEQVQQKECYNLAKYHAEIEYSIKILKNHLGRVEAWRRGEDDAGFNSEFVQLMEELRRS